MGFVARQPNGRLCLFSSIVDCPIIYQMTDDDYVEYCAERAREEARKNLQNKKFLKSMKMVVAETTDENMSEDELFKILRESAEPYDGDMIIL